MKKSLVFLFFVLVLLSCVSAEKVIVVLKDKPVSEFGVQSFDLSKRKLMVKGQQDKVLEKFDRKFSIMSDKKFKLEKKFNLVNGFSAEIDSVSLEELRNDPDVLKVYPVREYKINLDVSVPLVNADDANALQVSNNITGLDETVCVVDTGIDYNHASLSGVYVGGYDYCGDTGPCGTDPDDSDPFDNHWHGTHVSGIIASQHSTYRGVSPGAKIAAMKVMNASGNGNEVDIILGIEDCVDNKTIYNTSVISLSLGDGSRYSSSCDSDYTGFRDVINLAVLNDINVVVSSGNIGYKDGISSPACITNATSVGWSTDSDTISSNSNSASILDLLAPGNGIISTTPSNNFGSSSGTSMSAPHVAGAIALMRQFYREYAVGNLSVSESINVLKNNGVNLTDSNNITTPRIDVYSAILSFDLTAPSLAVDSPEDNGVYRKNNISLDYSASDDLSLGSVWYDFGGSNITLSGNTTLNLSEDNYNLTVYVNDSAGNLDSVFVNFSINLLIPVFDGLSPVDDFVSDSENLSFTCNASTNFELVNISFYHNLSGGFVLNQSLDVVGSENSSGFSLYDFDDNTNLSWYCNVYDNNTNYKTSEVRDVLVRINDAPLSLTISNLSWNENTDFDFNISLNFSDEEENIVGYGNTLVSNISVLINNNTGIVTLSPDSNFTGLRSVVFTAYDSEFSTDGNNVSLTVNNVIVCGDGLIEGSEECEGINLNNETCTSQDYDSGTLSCSSCSFDVSDCSNDGGNDNSAGASGGGGTKLSTTSVEEVEEESVTVSEESSSEEEVEEEIKEIVPEKRSFIGKVGRIIIYPFVWVKNLVVRLWVWVF